MKDLFLKIEKERALKITLEAIYAFENLKAAFI